MLTSKDLRKWQKRLGLMDWHIVLKTNVIPSDMNLEDVCGEAEYVESTRMAIVRILDPNCYKGCITKFDQEKTLVHELLHLKLSFFMETGIDLHDRVAHQLIDDLARAFVDAERSKT